ncbi:zinc finger and SCAN domain-containing protein 20-like [Natator depressus]|uniref:zinc finger and SCAN domain-containing protein 20-like n=1 Tax=Natator depressus TaxID=27790 RepID=UPI003EBB95EF
MQSPPSQETMQSWISRRAPAWAEREVLDLIACWGDESVMAELRSKKRNANMYAKVSRAMTERGYSRDTEQCRTKIKELRQTYQKAREANGRSGSQPHTCRFYRELHAVMGGDATTTPPLSVDTCKGVVARSEEDEFLEDKEEEEDSAQAVSTWPLSTPSQRLVQIRRWKKRTWDDMFAELMQSSHTDRAQLNAWRQTIAESRKAFDEHVDVGEMSLVIYQCLQHHGKVPLVVYTLAALVFQGQDRDMRSVYCPAAVKEPQRIKAIRNGLYVSQSHYP